MRAQHVKNIHEQQERLSKLAAKKEEKLKGVEELRDHYLKLQNELAEIEKHIKSATLQRQRLMDYGGDEKKIQAFTSEIADKEGRGLELLGELELNERDRSDARIFLTGIEKTITEIESEVKAEAAKEEEQISIIDVRLNGLKEDLPSEFKQVLEKLLSKNLAHGPFTRIDQGSCLFCRYKISRLEESEIDMQRKLKQCPQCSRIFIPYGT